MIPALAQWAAQWGIPPEAVADLAARTGVTDNPPATLPGDSEAAVQTRIRLEASRVGCRLWRNNVGATYTPDGAFIRYGLANDSAQMNKSIKSSDLIGIKPLRITPAMVGYSVGQFVAREVKAATWSYTGTKREAAQLRFIQLVQSFGGDAAFANSEGTL